MRVESARLAGIEGKPLKGSQGCRLRHDRSSRGSSSLL
jgi:hypothetical protein